jgi:hypothetical protein
MKLVRFTRDMRPLGVHAGDRRVVTADQADELEAKGEARIEADQHFPGLPPSVPLPAKRPYKTRGA